MVKKTVRTGYYRGNRFATVYLLDSKEHSFAGDCRGRVALNSGVKLEDVHHVAQTEARSSDTNAEALQPPCNRMHSFHVRFTKWIQLNKA